MRAILIIITAALLPFPVLASDTSESRQTNEATRAEDSAEVAASETEGEVEPDGLQFLDAAEVSLEEFLWINRLIVLLADSPNNPQLVQQLRYLEERAEEMLDRDVVVIVDADPTERSEVRQRLRPRGFMLVIIDKDGEIKQRRPAPRSGREIMAVIDRFPLRRQEMLERNPSGRD